MDIFIFFGYIFGGGLGYIHCYQSFWLMLLLMLLMHLSHKRKSSFFCDVKWEILVRWINLSKTFQVLKKSDMLIYKDIHSNVKYLFKKKQEKESFSFWQLIPPKINVLHFIILVIDVSVSHWSTVELIFIVECIIKLFYFWGKKRCLSYIFKSLYNFNWLQLYQKLL